MRESNRAPPFYPPFVQVQRQGCSALRAISLAPGGLSVCLEVGSVGPDVNVVGVYCTYMNNMYICLCICISICICNIYFMYIYK